MIFAQRKRMQHIDPSCILPFPPIGSVISSRNIILMTRDIPLQLLYSAYMQGIFPWFNEDEGEPVVWYYPDPRFCLQMHDFHVPKSAKKALMHTPFTYTFDVAFEDVLKQCRDMKRKGQNGTWIGEKMMNAYCAFHREGYAHSVEAWHSGNLAGGFYGVLIGSVFCGESMFTKESNSAKTAFILFAKAFARAGGLLIDSQVYTDNIARYGAKNISRDAFLRLESELLQKPLSQDIKTAFYQEAHVLKCDALQ